MRSTKNIIYKVKLKRKEKMEKAEKDVKTDISIAVSEDVFKNGRIPLVKWFKESFKLGLKEAKDEVDKLYEQITPNQHFATCNKTFPGDLYKASELLKNTPEGVNINLPFPWINVPHFKESDELPSHPKDLMERVKPVYIISVQRMNDIQKQNEDLKSKCKKLDEENNKLREQLNLKELSDALARCENLRVEAKKWESKYNDLLGSIKTLTQTFQ